MVFQPCPCPHFQSMISGKSENFPNHQKLVPLTNNLLLNLISLFYQTARRSHLPVFLGNLSQISKFIDYRLYFPPSSRTMWSNVLPLYNKTAILPGSNNISPFSSMTSVPACCFYFLFPAFLCCNFLKVVFSCSCCSMYPMLWNVHKM